jgi:hypothetical protein
MSKLNRSEFKQLLIERNKNIVDEFNDSETISEGALQRGAAALGLAISLLGQFASIPAADAVPPEAVADRLNDEFNDYDSEYYGQYKFSVESDGSVIVTNNSSGNKHKVLAADQCKNISSNELRKAVRGIQSGKSTPSSVSKSLKAAAHNSDSDSPNTQKQTSVKAKTSVAEKIKSMNKSDKSELISKFRGDEAEGNFNIEASQLEITAIRIFDSKKDVQKEFGSAENYFVFLIMKYNPQFRSYLTN